MAMSWRPMMAADLDGVAAVAAVGFPDHFEDRACFETRLAMHPRGCFVLADGPAISGYLVAYPWRADAAPALNARIEAIPEDAAVMYLHDLALLPEVRGGGRTREIVERIAGDARTGGWPAMALVAVNAAAGFWARHGFASREAPGMAAKLATYGPDARYMVRPL